jgi:hypothetical protein
MLRPKLVLKPNPSISQRQNDFNDPQLEIRIQSTTTRDSISSTRDWNIMQERWERTNRAMERENRAMERILNSS